jgi:hypothetical protein
MTTNPPEGIMQTAVTPATVRSVIELGLKSSWTPEQKGKPFKVKMPTN